MVYRLFSGAIVLFWCVMSFLLVRLVVNPESSGLNDVPVSHVVRMILLGGQTSELSISENGRPAGSFSLRPKEVPADEGHTLLLSGNVVLALPFMARQRVVWQGSVKTDRAFRLDAVEGLFGVRDSPNTVLIEFLPGKHLFRYQVKGENGAAGQSFPLDASGASMALKALGVDENAIDGIRKGLEAPVMTARRSYLNIRNEKIDAYLVSIRQGEAPLAEVYVSQLGQILFVRTAFGYTLGSEDVTPLADD